MVVCFSIHIEGGKLSVPAYRSYHGDAGDLKLTNTSAFGVSMRNSLSLAKGDSRPLETPDPLRSTVGFHGPACRQAVAESATCMWR